MPGASISVDLKRKRISSESIAAFGVVGFLAGVIVFLIARYAIAIPMLDDWEMVPPVIKAHHGQLTFADLFAQQQESRTIIPKLVFIAFSYGKFWDGRFEMMLSVLICCLTTLGIYRLIVRSGLSGAAAALVFLLSAVLVFTPAQHEIWLLASGFPSFVPAACIVWGIYIVTTHRPVAIRFWACVALAVCASFTLAHGLLAWGLTFPLILFAAEPGRTRARWFGCWFIATAACASIYFWHFRAQSDLPTFAPMKGFFEYWQYVAAFMASGLGRAGNGYPLAISVVIGSLFLLGYGAILLHFFFGRSEDGFRARILPWLAVGGYSIGSGCLAAMGRIEWGVAQALESRYVAFSIYLPIALIVLIALYWKDFSPAIRRHRLVGFSAVVLFFVGSLFLELLCAFDSIPAFRVRSAAARAGQSAVLFGLALDTSKAIEGLNYPRPHFVRQNADALDRLHLLRTPLVRTRELSKLRHTEIDGYAAAGWCDSLTTGTDGRPVAFGWAALPAKRRPADAVLLAYAKEQGDWTVFALSDAVLSRPDVAKTLRSAEQLWSGWRVVFANDALPRNAAISAWALDAKEGKLYRLHDEKANLGRSSGTETASIR